MTLRLHVPLESLHQLRFPPLRLVRFACGIDEGLFGVVLFDWDIGYGCCGLPRRESLWRLRLRDGPSIL